MKVSTPATTPTTLHAGGNAHPGSGPPDFGMHAEVADNRAAAVALMQCPGTALSRPKVRADPGSYKGLPDVHAGESRPAFRSGLQRQAGGPATLA